MPQRRLLHAAHGLHFSNVVAPGTDLRCIESTRTDSSLPLTRTSAPIRVREIDRRAIGITPDAPARGHAGEKLTHPIILRRVNLENKSKTQTVLGVTF